MPEVSGSLRSGPWFGHNGIAVSEMARSVAFYSHGLGLRPMSSRTVRDEYIKQIVQVEGTTWIDVTFMSLPSGEVVVELLEYAGASAGPSPSHPGSPGVAHLCLLVGDVQRAWDAALAAGGRPRSPGPVRIDSGPYQGGTGCYVTDPDGYTVELLQAAPGRSDQDQTSPDASQTWDNEHGQFVSGRPGTGSAAVPGTGDRAEM